MRPESAYFMLLNKKCTFLIITESLFHLKADTISTTLQVDICVFVFDIMFYNGQRYAWKDFIYKKVFFVEGSPLSTGLYHMGCLMEMLGISYFSYVV
jgi:hypothetical protein